MFALAGFAKLSCQGENHSHWLSGKLEELIFIVVSVFCSIFIGMPFQQDVC